MNFGLKENNLKTNNGFFKNADLNKIEPTATLELEKLRAFEGHPFKLYEGERLADMVDSIKENGVLVPIIVQSIDNNSYEILSGHNRVEAAKIAGFEQIPAIVRKNLTREEALLIVTETNLIQRSFTDLSHSERAVTLAMHHEAIKRQGKRTDLINEIENLLKNDENTAKNEGSETIEKINNVKKIGIEYGLSKDTVARYLRINQLSDELKNRLDNQEFGLIPAVEISYLSEEEQENLNLLLSDEYKLNMKKATQLREFSEKKELNIESCEQILAGIFKRKKTAEKVPKVVLKSKVLSRFFSAENKVEEIQDEIIAALEYWRKNKQKVIKIKTESDINGEKNMGDDEE